MEDVVTLLGRVRRGGGNRQGWDEPGSTRRGVGVDCGGPALSMRVSFPVAAATACMYLKGKSAVVAMRPASSSLQPAQTRRDSASQLGYSVAVRGIDTEFLCGDVSVWNNRALTRLRL